MAFIEEGGYENHEYWLAEGWDWVNQNECLSPCTGSRNQANGGTYTLAGLEQIDMDAPVSHISFYEADAFARWKGCRLPTEFEWEVAAQIYESEASPTSNFMEGKHLAFSHRRL